MLIANISELIIVCGILWPLLALCCVTDFCYFLLPNRLMLTLLAGIFILKLCTSPCLIPLHLGIACGIFAFCFALFSIHVMGGGDVKMISICVFWFADHLLPFVMCMAISGLVIGLIMRICHVPIHTLREYIQKKAGNILSAWMPEINQEHGTFEIHRNMVPYGIAISTACFYVSWICLQEVRLPCN